jgi:hypothetical protein
MVLFARDTHGTWRAYLRKMAGLFRGNPALQEQLIGSENSEDFLDVLRKAEKSMTLSPSLNAPY